MLQQKFFHIFLILLLLLGVSSTYAACIVDGTSYNVGGTGLTSSTAAGGAITLSIIKDDWIQPMMTLQPVMYPLLQV